MTAPSSSGDDQSDDPPFTSRQFRDVLGTFPTGVAIVTAALDAEPYGMAVSSFCSVSLDPAFVSFCPAKSSSTFPAIREAGTFCVNILSWEQQSLCRTFSSSPGDRFAEVHWRTAPSGSPILDDCVAWIDCSIESITEVGDHYIVIGRVTGLAAESEELPLVFYSGGYGHFAPFPLVAAAEADLTDRLYLADLARNELVRVAQATELPCLAATVVGDELVIVASVPAAARDRVPTRVGQRIPFMPPIGTAFLAWEQDSAITGWLGRGRSSSEAESEREHRRSLERVRSRGWSIGVGSAAHHEFEKALLQMAQSEPRHDQIRKLQQAIDRLGGEYEPSELGDHTGTGVRNLTTPVFDAGGHVVLALSLYGFPRGSSVEEVRPHITRMTEVASRITAAIGGEAPPRSSAAIGTH